MPTPLTPKAHDPLPTLTEAQRILIQDARDRIANPQNWTQGQMARTATGKPVDHTSGRAKCWCAVGSIYRTTGEYTIITKQIMARMNQVTARLMDDDRVPLTAVNDDSLAQVELPEQLRPLTPHQRVLFIFDEVLKT